jgi:hypothetical protein
MQFQKASKKQSRLRLSLIGPGGSGKTYTALRIAKHLGGRTALIDTEHGSASKYADEFEFDTLELRDFNPRTYVEAIHMAEEAGYQLLIIDSLSHAWAGKGGALELVDNAAARSKSGNKWTAWRDVTPLHNDLVEAILQSPCHVICTMRAKTEYIQEKDDQGKTRITKIGMQPVQRDGMEYEFDVVGDLSIDHQLVISKTRCSALDGKVIPMPGKEIADTLRTWLTDGAAVEIPDGAAINQAPQEASPSLAAMPLPTVAPVPRTGKAGWTKFYTRVLELGMTLDDGKAIVAECEQDLARSFELLELRAKGE